MGKKDDWSFKVMGKMPIFGGKLKKIKIKAEESTFLKRRKTLRGLKKGGTVTKG